MNLPDLQKKFYDQRQSAKVREIEFLLTFDEWLQTWIDSGHLEERGQASKQYCMARFGDIGPYVVGNVKIITNYQNAKEMHAHRVIDDQVKAKMRASALVRDNSYLIGRKLSEEHKENIRKNSNKGKKLVPFSTQHRKNLSHAAKKRRAREKATKAAIL